MSLIPRNGQSGLPPACMYQTWFRLYIIDIEIKPLSTEWVKKAHAVNSSTADSFSKRLIQSKIEKLSTN